MLYLVTGAGGFIGSSLTEELLAEGHGVIGVDCFRDNYDPAQKRENLEGPLRNPLFTLIEADLSTTRGMEELASGVPPGDQIVVYHLAARAGVRTSWGREFNLYLNDNVLATQDLLEWAAGRGTVANFVYASSSSVYGRVESMPMTEDSTVPRPDSPYGVTKLAGENLVRLYAVNRGLPSVSLRFFTVYGPRQRPDMAFRIFMEAVLAGSPIRIYGDGAQTRDFTFVTDVVRGLRLAENCTDGRAMNIGGGHTLALSKAVAVIEKVMGRKAVLEFLPVQPGDVRDTFASTELLRRTTGWSPDTTIEDGLRAQYDWLTRHR